MSKANGNGGVTLEQCYTTPKMRVVDGVLHLEAQLYPDAKGFVLGEETFTKTDKITKAVTVEDATRFISAAPFTNQFNPGPEITHLVPGYGRIRLTFRIARIVTSEAKPKPSRMPKAASK